jgi:3-isopropylmalate dehydratase small subunit
VDCFISLGIQCLIAESFGSIYERNAINAAFPIISNPEIPELKLEDGDELHVNFLTGEIRNITRNISVKSMPFSEVQMEIYQKNGLF